jgi:hypothetical protein
VLEARPPVPPLCAADPGEAGDQALAAGAAVAEGGVATGAAGTADGGE